MLRQIKRQALGLLMLTVSAPLLAAGMTSHAMMADQARFHLPPDHPLIGLLAAHRPALIAGAMYPDGGYFTGSGFAGDRDLAETAHWDGFVDALSGVAHEAGCGDLPPDAWDSAPGLPGTIDWLADELARETSGFSLRTGEGCGHLVAFLMGLAAHGMGDEVWDALFEPAVYQRNEMQNGHQTTSPGYILDSVPPGSDPSVGEAIREQLGDDAFAALSQGFEVINGVEYAMDVIAIRDEFAWDEVPALVFPPAAYLVEAYARHGKSFDEFAIQRAAAGSRLIVAAERIGAAADYVRVRDQMPWTVHNYLAGSGGIRDTATYIAGYYEHIWDRVVNGPANAMAPFIVGMHPKAGERGLPAAACDNGNQPFNNCLDPRRPIADRYIYVSLSGSPGSNFAELDEPFAVFDEDGDKLAVKFRQLPPWGSPMDAHGFRIELEDKVLKPNHRYTVVVTTQLYDRRGPDDPKARLAEPRVWHFSTGPE